MHLSTISQFCNLILEQFLCDWLRLFSVLYSQYDVGVELIVSMMHFASGRGLVNSCNPVQVDFLPATAVSEEELAKQRELAAGRVNSLRNIVTVIDGVQSNFEIIIDSTFT